ncbi:kinesin motor domain protein [Gregarina niphandrodes]|uniref:Kinesin motor domain protein n=1 Tax=Gregarina niphandrodes TaxID=110365 RepID=A0A023AYJ4_GRENI|nr:kinesin motor domain protein [Gregarina niphandrodes]EZG43731.1 kinesin motor domain protein [Gregarina niphandrodes]|eukprot:XP_011133040.1 kinesin motor domain protein [Gregarina niphandrodes]
MQSQKTCYEQQKIPHEDVHVKVVVRCRPCAEASEVLELRPAQKEICVFDVHKGPQEHRYISNRNRASTADDHSRSVSNHGLSIHGLRQQPTEAKSYVFDGVCGPDTTQEELFEAHIVPLVEEVLQGFNCTIFAYGQTGTGKTYTMEGDWNRDLGSEPSTPNLGENVPTPNTIRAGRTPLKTPSKMCVGSGIPTPPLGGYNGNIQLPKGVGMIPRSVALIFKRLNKMNCESSLKVSFLEIYNEDLVDLLQMGDKLPLRIYDNTLVTRGLAVKNLTEIPVSSLPEVYKVLSHATKKRKTAETSLNRQSSRSHSIFAITITIKEISTDGEDVIRIGKLNLVDLAGSENIQRSGTDSNTLRTKEAGIINQSLVALGRVINALITPSSYVPYRDSKLTRLLQDSLGGRTKTCIIATISSSIHNFDETLSTLDYAHRAKHIKNTPQVNQRMSQKFLMKELHAELDKLKRELQIARERSGEVHLTNETYKEIELQLYEFHELQKTSNNMKIKLEQELTASNNKLNEYKLESEQYFQELRELNDDYNNLRNELNKINQDYYLETRVSEKLWGLATSLKNKESYFEQHFLAIGSYLLSFIQHYERLLDHALEFQHKNTNVNNQLINENDSYLTTYLEIIDRIKTIIKGDLEKSMRYVKNIIVALEKSQNLALELFENLTTQCQNMTGFCEAAFRKTHQLYAEKFTETLAVIKNEFGTKLIVGLYKLIEKSEDVRSYITKTEATWNQSSSSSIKMIEDIGRESGEYCRNVQAWYRKVYKDGSAGDGSHATGSIRAGSPSWQGGKSEMDINKRPCVVESLKTNLKEFNGTLMDSVKLRLAGQEALLNEQIRMIVSSQAKFGRDLMDRLSSVLEKEQDRILKEVAGLERWSEGVMREFVSRSENSAGRMSPLVAGVRDSVQGFQRQRKQDLDFFNEFSATTFSNAKEIGKDWQSLCNRLDDDELPKTLAQELETTIGTLVAVRDKTDNLIRENAGLQQRTMEGLFSSVDRLANFQSGCIHGWPATSEEQESTERGSRRDAGSGRNAESRREAREQEASVEQPKEYIQRDDVPNGQCDEDAGMNLEEEGTEIAKQVDDDGGGQLHSLDQLALRLRETLGVERLSALKSLIDFQLEFREGIVNEFQDKIGEAQNVATQCKTNVLNGCPTEAVFSLEFYREQEEESVATTKSFFI